MVAIPLAMSPSQRTPGVALAFDFLSAASGAGTSPLRALIIASKRSSGTITNNVLERDVAGESAAATLLGAGSVGHLAARALFRENPLAAVDIIAPAASGGVVATGSIVFDDATAVTVAQTVTATIAGRQVSIAWLAAETDVAAATKLVDAINAIGDELPVVASNSSGSSATVTLTFCIAGLIGNDTTYSVTASGGTGGSVTAGAANFASGTLDMDITTALTKITTIEYDYIVLVTSNTDATSASSSSNPRLLAAHILQYGEGGNALLQQMIVACTGSLSGLKTATAAINFGQAQAILARSCQSFPGEWAGAEAGARMRERQLYAVKNRIKMVYKATLYGPLDHVSGDLTPTELEDALQHGITPITFDATYRARPDRPVTTYYKDSGGNADDRILDVTRVDGIFTVAKDLRVEIPRVFSGKSISPDLPTGDDELPADVVEIGTVRAFVIQRLRLWQGKGVIQKDKLDEAIGTQQNPGTLIVQINDDDPTMVESVIPLATIKPFAKMSLVFIQAA